jgi:hypothetical protein
VGRQSFGANSEGSRAVGVGREQAQCAPRVERGGVLDVIAPPSIPVLEVDAQVHDRTVLQHRTDIGQSAGGSDGFERLGVAVQQRHRLFRPAPRGVGARIRRTHIDGVDGLRLRTITRKVLCERGVDGVEEVVDAVEAAVREPTEVLGIHSTILADMPASRGVADPNYCPGEKPCPERTPAQGKRAGVR